MNYKQPIEGANIFIRLNIFQITQVKFQNILIKLQA